jgi:hypothetical protein
VEFESADFFYCACPVQLGFVKMEDGFDGLRLKVKEKVGRKIRGNNTLHFLCIPNLGNHSPHVMSSEISLFPHQLWLSSLIKRKSEERT